MLPRLLLGCAALATAAFLAVSLGAVRAERRAIEVAFSPDQVSKPRLQAAIGDARAARRLTPDSRPLLIEAFLLFRIGRPDSSERALLRVARSEPENVTAWISLAGARSGGPLSREASRRVRQLDPLSARRR